MNLNKKREKYLKKKIKQHSKYIKKDIKHKYCRGDKFYRISIDSTSVIQLNDINIVNDIVEKFLKDNNINYQKRITKYDPSFIGEIKYVFMEVEDE